MNSDVSEVRDLLRVISRNVDKCQEFPSSKEIGKALFSLHSMSSDVPEVRELLRILSGKTENCKEAFSSQNVGMSLYGLQNMSSDVPEVREVLQVLSRKIDGCQEAFGTKFLANGLYGLLNMTLDLSWKAVLLKILNDIEQQVHADCDLNSDENFKLLIGAKQALSIILFTNNRNSFRKTLVSFNLLGDFSRLLTSIDAQISKYLASNENGSSNFQSHSERKYATHIINLFRHEPHIEILTNRYLFGFEADIIIRVLHDNGRVSVINVEIDGIHHQRSRKQMFSKYRDEFLICTHRVQVVRVNLCGIKFK
jgi:hypothetical protein